MAVGRGNSVNVFTKKCVSVVMSRRPLQDYRLVFEGWSQRWQGATASIAPAPGDVMYGVVWRLHTRHQATLDRLVFRLHPRLMSHAKDMALLQDTHIHAAHARN